MNFYWNDWSAVNLRWDLFFLASFFIPLRLILLGRRRRLADLKFDFAFAVRFTLALAVHAALAGGVLAWAGKSGFLTVRYFWTMLSVALPCALAIFALRRTDRMRWPALALALAALMIKFYAEVFEPANLEVERIVLESPRITGVVRIAHISDVQTDGVNSALRRARTAVTEFSPDLIVFTGDVLNHRRLIPEVAAYLHSFHAPGRSFFVTGDHDAILPRPQFFNASGYRVIDGQRVSLNIRGSRVDLIGWDLPDFRRPASVTGLRGRPDAFSILMSHPPDSIFLARRRSIDLVIAGHTHGGQVVVPFFGPPITLSRVPRAIAAGGLHQFEDLQVIVSRGLGMEGGYAPRIRFLCRPHLVLIELRPATAQIVQR